MTKWIVGTSCAVLLSATMAGAQQNPQPGGIAPADPRPDTAAPTQTQQPATPSAPAVASAAVEMTTISGCLANGTGTPQQFELSVVGAAAPGSRTSAGAVGTSGSTATTKYRLMGGDNLTQYNGKRIEVRGTKVEAHGGSEIGAAVANSATPTAQDFRVTSVKEVTGGAPCP